MVELAPRGDLLRKQQQSRRALLLFEELLAQLLRFLMQPNHCKWIFIRARHEGARQQRRVKRESTSLDTCGFKPKCNSNTQFTLL